MIGKELTVERGIDCIAQCEACQQINLFVFIEINTQCRRDQPYPMSTETPDAVENIEGSPGAGIDNQDAIDLRIQRPVIFDDLKKRKQGAGRCEPNRDDAHWNGEPQRGWANAFRAGFNRRNALAFDHATDVKEQEWEQPERGVRLDHRRQTEENAEAQPVFESQRVTQPDPEGEREKDQKDIFT